MSKVSKVDQHISVNGNTVKLNKGESYNNYIVSMYPYLFEEYIKEELLFESPSSVDVVVTTVTTAEKLKLLKN